MQGCWLQANTVQDILRRDSAGSQYIESRHDLDRRKHLVIEAGTEIQSCNRFLFVSPACLASRGMSPLQRKQPRSDSAPLIRFLVVRHLNHRPFPRRPH